MAMEYMPWWPASSWISPGAALFLLCNALIGAIVVTSSRGEQGGRARRLCRSASSMVLDRLRSFSMFSVHAAAVEDFYHTSLELEPEEEQQQQPQPAVAEPAIATAAPVSTLVAAAAASAATASESAMELVSRQEGEEKAVTSSEEDEGPAWQGHEQQSPSPAAAAAAEATAAAEPPATVAGSIVQRARACRREALEGKAALNARAEVFIRQFREDLKLQRLNSIINYTRSLRRGAGAAAAAGQ